MKDSSNVQSIGEAVVQATEQLKASFASQSAYEIEVHDNSFANVEQSFVFTFLYRALLIDCFC